VLKEGDAVVERGGDDVFVSLTSRTVGLNIDDDDDDVDDFDTADEGFVDTIKALLFDTEVDVVGAIG